MPDQPDRFRQPERVRERMPPVPTGPVLLALVLRTGHEMLAAETHAEYVKRHEGFIYLLTIAERDLYCAPILISYVQDILDDESKMFHDRKKW